MAAQGNTLGLLVGTTVQVAVAKAVVNGWVVTG